MVIGARDPAAPAALLAYANAAEKLGYGPSNAGKEAAWAWA